MGRAVKKDASASGLWPVQLSEQITMGDANVEDQDSSTSRQRLADDNAQTPRAMDRWPSGQGYPISSYKGGLPAARASLQVIHGCGDDEEAELLKIKQNFVDYDQ